MARKTKDKDAPGTATLTEERAPERSGEPRNLVDPDHGTRTRHSDRPEFDDSEKDAGEGWSNEATARTGP